MQNLRWLVHFVFAILNINRKFFMITVLTVLMSVMFLFLFYGREGIKQNLLFLLSLRA